MVDRRTLSEAYFDKSKLSGHHIETFNQFLDFGMQRVVDEQEAIEASTGDEDVFVRLGAVRLETPKVHEAGGGEKVLFPHEARLRNITYSAPVWLEMQVVEEGYEHEPEIVKIGELPIMVRSKRCNLDRRAHLRHLEERKQTEFQEGKRKQWENWKDEWPPYSPREPLNDDKLVKRGEDPHDPGGYFIVNGSERVLVATEDLSPNTILAEKDEKYGGEIERAKVFSHREGYRALVAVERGLDSLLKVDIPSVKQDVSFIPLVKALGLEEDQEIVNAVSEDPDIVKFMLENLEESEAPDQQGAFDIICKQIAKGQAKEYRERRTEHVLERYLLPHLNIVSEDEERIKIAKAHYLCRMAEVCFELALGRRKEDDKDHYANKLLRVSGDLMEDLFRVALSKLARDIRYQLERAEMRERELRPKTIVRADVLTERLEHPLATGNWVGGRTGVAQLLDRSDHMSALSHLRRLRSPLSRGQPHFEARDLHSTQWGRICPNETPEGPNCGLVKNFAQAVEISKGVERIEQLEEKLSELGVEKIGRNGR